MKKKLEIILIIFFTIHTVFGILFIYVSIYGVNASTFSLNTPIGSDYISQEELSKMLTLSIKNVLQFPIFVILWFIIFTLYFIIKSKNRIYALLLIVLSLLNVLNIFTFILSLLLVIHIQRNTADNNLMVHD